MVTRPYSEEELRTSASCKACPPFRPFRSALALGFAWALPLNSMAASSAALLPACPALAAPHASSACLALPRRLPGGAHGPVRPQLRGSFSAPRWGARATRAPAARASAVAVTEPVTGVGFPPTFSAPGLSAELSLLGTGVREKKIAIIRVKVYAVALYVDLAATPAAGTGKTAEALAADSAFFAGIANAPAEKAFVITLVRNVTTDQFVNALNEELVPKLQAAGADVAVMGQLGEFFKGRPLTKDSAVVISRRLPATLQISFIDDVKGGYGAQTMGGSIDSLPLLNALFDLYLGADPISPSLPTSIAATAAAMA